VINFDILGAVRAWDGGWEASLQPRQQLMLAALVLAGGALVSWSDLERALGWDEREQPVTRGPKGVAHELRIQLRPALPDGGPLPGGDGAYRLPIDQRQADVLRFRAAAEQARHAEGPERSRLLRAALREWGADAVGLRGGYPLSGLPGAWADSTRATLRQEHRDAVLDCISQDMDGGQYKSVLGECWVLASDLEALTDDAFVEKWMLAAYWSGERTQAEQIFRQAATATERSLGLAPSRRLLVLAEAIRNEDPRLGIPATLLDRGVVAVRHAASIAVAEDSALVPLPSVPQSASQEHQASRDDPASTERTAVSEPNVTFNITGNARVSDSSLIGVNKGNLTIYSAPAQDAQGAQEASDDADDNVGDPDSPDR
jgi:DNA-binding SARP family transcriptional activator